jgi:hypothetical protein
MAIYNLGTLQQPEEKTNPYVENLMKFGMQSALNQQEIAGKKDIVKTQGEMEAKTFLAKRAIEQEDATRKNLTATWQSLSDKPETEQKLFMETDRGKEYLKTVKKYLPDLFDANGSPILFPSTKDTIKQELDSKISTVKNKLLTEGPNALNEGERSILQMDGYKDEIAEVTSSLYKNPEFMYLLEDPNRKDPKTGKTNAEVAQELVRQAIQQRIALRKGMSSGVGINDLSSVLGDTKDPLGLIGK